LPAMPPPIRRLPIKASTRPMCWRLATYSATADARMATRSDARTVGHWYSTGTGRGKASIPLKCIAQMPMPLPAPQPCQADQAAVGGYASRKVERGIGRSDGYQYRASHLAVVVGAGHRRVCGDHPKRSPLPVWVSLHTYARIKTGLSDH